MYIRKVISFKDAWGSVVKNNSAELSELADAVDRLLYIRGASKKDFFDFDMRSVWDRTLSKKGWELDRRSCNSSERKRYNIGLLGPIKNGVSSALVLGSFGHLSRWLFQQSMLAVKDGLITVPILLTPIDLLTEKMGFERLRKGGFEQILEQLELLSPLSHQYPFLIIGFSYRKNIEEPQVIEIEADSYVGKNNSVVDRSIEFPPEYYQSGLGILTYFGTYLREQYPEENASVKIAQEGLSVRMIIETEDGKSETVEKALHEYELIVTGAESPERFTNSDKLIFDLKNELRIAGFRLESQKDIIGLQNRRIDKLLNILADGLSQKNQIAIDFKPDITISNSVKINQDVSSVLGSLNELLDELPRATDAHVAFNDLEGSLASIETNNDPESVRESPAMVKFKRLIDKVLDDGSALNLAIKKADKGWEIFSDIATKYNKLARWCALPVVPEALLK